MYKRKNEISKIIAPALGKTYGGRGYKIYCEIVWNTEKKNLSIHGVEGPLPSGNCLGSCGQIKSELLKMANGNDLKYLAGWSKKLLLKFLEVWGEYHLNDMQAGCEHQCEKGKKYQVSEICPVCGYKYGHGWNRKEVPEEVLEFLWSLPNSEKKPAWV